MMTNNTDMRRYVVNGPDNAPLTWDEKAIYFPSLLSANAFIEATKRYVPEPEEDYYTNAVARSQILFYDGGYISVDDITPAQFNEDFPGFYDEYLRILKNYENG